MEHIHATFHGRATQMPAAPLRVIGAMNEVIEKLLPQAKKEARAAVFARSEVVILTESAAAQAIIYQHQEELQEALNKLLTTRYGGPVVERVVCRRTTVR